MSQPPSPCIRENRLLESFWRLRQIKLSNDIRSLSYSPRTWLCWSSPWKDDLHHSGSRSSISSDSDAWSRHSENCSQHCFRTLRVRRDAFRSKKYNATLSEIHRHDHQRLIVSLLLHRWYHHVRVSRTTSRTPTHLTFSLTTWFEYQRQQILIWPERYAIPWIYYQEG
jgi:hypothetical protein